MPSIITESHVNIIERYLSSVYYPQEKFTSLSDLRVKHYFKNPDPKLRTLIISRDGLLKHMKRSALQAGWLWKECEHNVVHPSPAEWGWKKENNMFTPQWCDNHKTIDDALVTCGCQLKGKCQSCRCGKRKFPCIEFCNCSRNCIER